MKLCNGKYKRLRCFTFLTDGNVVCGLRRCENMKRLVYVSCDPANACKNFINLARGKSKQYKGDFFIPIRYGTWVLQNSSLLIYLYIYFIIYINSVVGVVCTNSCVWMYFLLHCRAVPIDLFPHTPHFELVILFERWDELKWRRIMEGKIDVFLWQVLDREMFTAVSSTMFVMFTGLWRFCKLVNS